MFQRLVLFLALFFCSEIALCCYKPPDVVGTCDIEQQMIAAINKFRANNGFPAFKYARELNWSARKWAENIAATNDISHRGFPVLRNQTIILEFPASNMKVAGETLAYFYLIKPGNFAQHFVENWLRSPAHRDLIMRPFNYVGIGFARKGNGQFAVANFAY